MDVLRRFKLTQGEGGGIKDPSLPDSTVVESGSYKVLFKEMFKGIKEGSEGV